MNFFLVPFFVTDDDANVTTKTLSSHFKHEANSHCFFFDISKGRMEKGKHWVVAKNTNLNTWDAFEEGVMVSSCGRNGFFLQSRILFKLNLEQLDSYKFLLN